MTSRTPAQYDWPKALFNDKRLTKHFTHPRRSKISHVTLHHMTIVSSGTDASNTKALNGCYTTWQSREASANYGVAGNQVWQFVSDNDAPWADANNTSNQATLAIEHANSKGAPGWDIADTTLATGQRLVANLHKLYGLGRPTRKTVRVHRDFYATSCPGPYMMAHLDAYIAAAAKIYDTLGKPPVTPTPPAKPKNTLTILTNNLWGYGKAESSATQAARLPQFVAMVKHYMPDMIAVQELSNQGSDKKKQAGDSTAKTPYTYVMDNLHDLGYAYDSIGSDGRYIFRLKSAVDFIAGKTILMTPEYKGDNKQAAIGVYKKGDRTFSLASAHTENEGTDDKYRVGQTNSLISQNYDFAKVGHDVISRWHIYAGDFNDHDKVLGAFKAKGYVDSFTRAPLAHRIKAAVQSFAAYLNVKNGPRIDLVAVYKDVTVLSARQITEYADSDHHPQLVEIQL